MHRYSLTGRPLSAIVMAAALAFSSLGFAFVASPAAAATTISLSNTPTSLELGESFTSTATITGSSGGISFVQFLVYGPDVFEEFLTIRAAFDINKRAEGDWKRPGSGYVGMAHQLPHNSDNPTGSAA